MAQSIHARQTDEGLRFRVWSISKGSYLTEEMTEEEIRLSTLQMAVSDAIAAHQMAINGRIKTAIANGTSLLGDSRFINGPWDEENV